ncbi:hypothetical protein LCGC14_0455560 [marine sediment metagenome]|uniref:7-cyano-7-deazaguanine synthase n=1 Tax=marine sediment metagenome TaxID=412755 RepID=A0A0F9SGI6_9ZZZZ
MTTAVCELSGGYDSALSTLLALRKYDSVFGVFTNYGQVYAEQERASAEYLAEWFTRYPSWRGLTRLKCTLSQALPDQSDSPYIPVRNLVLGTLSANFAQAHGANVVVVGSKTTEYRPDDPYCWYDCTTEFYEGMGALVSLAAEAGHEIRYEQSLILDGQPLTKAQVLEALIDEGIALIKLWNCYEAGERPCQKCFHCLDMRKTLEGMGQLTRFEGWW